MKRIREFLQKHFVKLCIMVLCIGVMGYFINIIFFENKKDVLTVLVLATDVDREELTEEIKKAVDVNRGEEISIQTLDYSNKVNQGVAITWLRSGTIDILVGNKEQMTVFEHYGYLRKLEETKFTTDKEKFMCGIADFDDDGNILNVEGDYWVGVSLDKIAGIYGIESLVISIMENAPNKESAMKTLEQLCNR